MIKLKKGTRVELSTKGHRGFFYPSEVKRSLLYDVNAIEVSWVGGGPAKRAALIPENSLFVSGKPDKNITIWIDKNIHGAK